MRVLLPAVFAAVLVACGGGESALDALRGELRPIEGSRGALTVADQTDEELQEFVDFVCAEAASADDVDDFTDEMFYRAQLVVGEMDSAATADWGRNYLAAMEAGGCADAF